MTVGSRKARIPRGYAPTSLGEEWEKQKHAEGTIQQPKHQIAHVLHFSAAVFFGNPNQFLSGQQFID